jgi:predicted ATPase
MTRRDEVPQPVRSESSRGPLAPPTPIVGRQRELTAVMTCYEAAKGGRARVVLVTGEPGMGKTRLLDEVALRSAQDGQSSCAVRPPRQRACHRFCPLWRH